MLTFTVNRRPYRLDPSRVRRSLSGLLPDPVREHYVVIDGRRWPPKQVLSAVTGLDRADFTTHQARRILLRLGFPAARRGSKATLLTPTPEPRFEPEHAVEALRPYIGQWVAVQDQEVLVAAETAAEVVSWLARHERRADSLFRVPEGDHSIGGAAPA